MGPRGGPRFLWALPTQPPATGPALLSCPVSSWPSPASPLLWSPVWEKAAPARTGMWWLTLGQSRADRQAPPLPFCPSVLPLLGLLAGESRFLLP